MLWYKLSIPYFLNIMILIKINQTKLEFIFYSVMVLKLNMYNESI